VGWFKKIYQFILMLRAAAALSSRFKHRIRDMLRGDGAGWSAAC